MDALNVISVMLAALEENIGVWWGHLCLQCVCVWVCEKGGGIPGLLCVGRALSETGPRGPELKPYLRGFGTDGVPLFEDVFIIRKWGERWKQHPLPPPSLLLTHSPHPRINTPHPPPCLRDSRYHLALFPHWIVTHCTRANRHPQWQTKSSPS